MCVSWRKRRAPPLPTACLPGARTDVSRRCCHCQSSGGARREWMCVTRVRVIAPAPASRSRAGRTRIPNTPCLRPPSSVGRTVIRSRRRRSHESPSTAVAAPVRLRRPRESKEGRKTADLPLQEEAPTA